MSGTELQVTGPVGSPAAYLFEPEKFEQMKRIATAMAHASLIPDHLRGNAKDPEQAWRQTVGNCLLIVNQAVRWGMDPFAVAPESYVVRGKLGFQGKLIAAVVHAKGNLRGRLGYSFHGEGNGRTVTVAGQFADEDEPRTITLSVQQAKTDNAMWRTDPDQKLVYSGVTKWARRHCPELMLGVLSADDLDRMAVSRLDGSAAADHIEQAKQQREEAEEQKPPQEPPAAASGPRTFPLPPKPPEPDGPPETPVGLPESGQGVEAASAAAIEQSAWAQIEAAKMIATVNEIERSIDLDSPAAQRLKKACANQRVLIRSQRGGKGSKDGENSDDQA